MPFHFRRRAKRDDLEEGSERPRRTFRWFRSDHSSRSESTSSSSQDEGVSRGGSSPASGREDRRSTDRDEDQRLPPVSFSQVEGRHPPQIPGSRTQNEDLLWDSNDHILSGDAGLPKLSVSREGGNVKVSGLEDVPTTALHPDIPEDWFGSEDFFAMLAQAYFSGRGKKNELPILFRGVLLMEEAWALILKDQTRIARSVEGREAKAKEGEETSEGDSAAKTEKTSEMEVAQDDIQNEEETSRRDDGPKQEKLTGKDAVTDEHQDTSAQNPWETLGSSREAIKGKVNEEMLQNKEHSERKVSGSIMEAGQGVREFEETDKGAESTFQATAPPQNNLNDGVQTNTQPMSLFSKLSALENITRDYLLWELRTEIDSITQKGTTDREQLLRIRELFKENAQIWGTGDFWLSVADSIQKTDKHGKATRLFDSLFLRHTGAAIQRRKPRSRFHARRPASSRSKSSRSSRSSRSNNPTRVNEQFHSRREAFKDIRKARRMRKLQLWPRVAVAVFGAAAFLVPMIIMAIHPSNTKSIAVSSAFIVCFALAFAVFASTTAETVLVATAAYAAVLVVFVGANNNQSGQ